jgi:hypothetical protein
MRVFQNILKNETSARKPKPSNTPARGQVGIEQKKGAAHNFRESLPARTSLAVRNPHCCTIRISWSAQFSLSRSGFFCVSKYSFT